MLYLNPSNPNIFVALNTHYRFMKCYVYQKIGANRCSDMTCKVCRYSRTAINPFDNRIDTFLSQNNYANVDRILKGLPADLDLVNTQLWLILYPNDTITSLLPYFPDIHHRTLAKKPQAFRQKYADIQDLKKQLNKIFDYTWFSKKTNNIYSAYQLSKTLDRYTCTYCNRSFTSTVFHDGDTPVIRPTLDHWFPKSEYPLLAVSFYNLVPSCYPCNSSVKGSFIPQLGTHIHPYADPTQTSDFEFDYNYTSLKGYRISVIDTPNGKKLGSKAKATLEEMHMDDIYSSNISELRDLLTIKKNYSTKYVSIMQGILKVKMSKAEVYRILFGAIYDQESFHKRPLSKFKYDILKKLGMLDDIEKS